MTIDKMEIEQYVNVEKALLRMGIKVKLFKILLESFLQDTPSQFEQLQKEIEENNREAASKSVHALKGVAANLSLTALYDLCLSFEALLKTDVDISETLASFNTVYKKTVECVNEILPTLSA